MIFKGIHHQKAELTIINYQYPEVTKGWDGNWLYIQLKAENNLGSWKAADPALTTWEVQEAIEWFAALSKGKKPASENLTFTEPNLSFQLLNSHTDLIKHIRIHFKLEFRSPFTPPKEECFVDIEVDDQELRRIKDEMIQELSGYPVRK